MSINCVIVIPKIWHHHNKELWYPSHMSHTGVLVTMVKHLKNIPQTLSLFDNIPLVKSFPKKYFS